MKAFRGYIFDLDGTIYLGQHAIEGAVQTVNALLGMNKKILFLTNKTIESRDSCVRKLNKLGIPVTLEHILSPAVVTTRMLQERYHDKKVYVVGEEVFKKELRDSGVRFADSPEETDVIVLSWDRQFHYDMLNFAYQAIKKNGAIVIATNPDRTCPLPEGEVPDCGSIIGAIEGATGGKVQTITGKPSCHMAAAALQALGLEAEECIMVGDRLETDIRMGQIANIHTALVLTGVARREDISSSGFQPEYVLQSVRDLVAAAD
ncbi:HAD-IIA family hydrolase [Paenibacillus sp. J5C_2022]|uniref:HAD-IIA family hydrolase n=1 Tax=Paenibacillus sp. J5C2022 TaxID=2977129 RepID=UPI0021D2738A|nr:HAD-IIA family hydrolase [Paenibacillus sp. J5C2022]MCU6709907.1 HAD-IIA family hydrolase [Paenibacillus sp. J5C2022]